jgi:hypothetical protein
MQALQPHAGLRVRGHERLHVAAHVVQPHRVDGGHPHRPLHPLPRGGEIGPRLFESLEQRPAGVVEGAALVGGQERTAGAVEQRGVELGLQLLDGLARRGLRDGIGGGPAGDAAQPDHVAVELQRLEVHGPDRTTISNANVMFFYLVLG